MKREQRRRLHRHETLRRTALAVAISGSLVLAFGGVAYAQAVNGRIHGTVPVASNEAIQITGGSGYDRTIPVGATGKYSVTLPVGTYTVSLLQNGNVIQTRSDVSPVAAGGVTVNFTTSAKNATQLSAITVSASEIPAIDVSTTTQVTTITAQQLKQLPLGRSAEAIALLSPGVQMGSLHVFGGPLGTDTIDFGGSTTAENAYYLDGMNTTYQLINQGGITLPYGAIAEQQTMISGYGAKYGRSIGGVINQIGKGGTNQWHFGVHALYILPGLQSNPRNLYWANPREKTTGEQPGDLLANEQLSSSMNHTYSAYVSGPIIKNKLLFYVALEKEKIESTSTSPADARFPVMSTSWTHQPKVYAKLTWNINSNNFLTLTGLQDQNKGWGTTWNLDPKTKKVTTVRSHSRTDKISFIMWVANYTSYITDNLSMHAMFGRQRGEFWYHTPPYPGYDPNTAYVFSPSNQNPKYTPDGFISSPNTVDLALFNKHQSSIVNYRLSFDYRLDNHDLQWGIDNIMAWDNNDGSRHSGPGYAWLYGHSDPAKDIVEGTPNVPPYVAPPSSNSAGTSGYWVAKQVVNNVASILDVQRAQYFVDHCHITPRLLLNLGIRNSQFTNYNADHVPYIKLTKPQWSPRLGFSWDVNGDSSLKVFGNAGRYYLAMPNKSGLWVGTKQVYVNQYGTYTGINQQTGAPIGFKPLPQNPATGVSPIDEYGNTVRDARLVAARNIQAEFSDNYVLGLKKKIHFMGQPWVFGVTGTYTNLRRIIDDYRDIQRECTAGRAQGLSFLTPQACGQYATGILLINPAENAVLEVKGPNGQFHTFNFTAKDQGFPDRPERKYMAVNFALTHVWDGKWFAKFDYEWSRLWGNSEGPVSALYEQAGSYDSVNDTWMYPEIQDHANGYLPSDRRNVIKAYGAYALTPQWTVGANFLAESGQPYECIGYYGPNEVALFGRQDYHYCRGKPASPGSLGRFPWVYDLDLNVVYRPAWADHKLRIRAEVFNVWNADTPEYRDQYSGTDAVPNPYFLYIEGRQPRRFLRFSFAYNF